MRAVYKGNYNSKNDFGTAIGVADGGRPGWRYIQGVNMEGNPFLAKCGR